MNIHRYYFDTLVIGSGLAGLRAAIECKEKGSVAVFSKLYPTRSHSIAAQGGIGAALGNEEPDDPEWHYYDTVKGSDYLGDQDAIEVMCYEAIPTIIELEHMGVPFSRTKEGKIAQRRFGGHTKEFGKAPVRRACYSADRTGHCVLFALFEQSVAKKVTFFEEFQVVDIIIENNEAQGLIAINIKTGELYVFESKAIVVACGGYGKVFKVTSNAYSTTGECLSMLFEQGLPLEDMEFFQFHPTGLYRLGILITEGARGEGGVLINGKGERFMEAYAPTLKDLAPRDLIARAILTEIREGRGINGKDYVYLDLRHIPKKVLQERLPEITTFCKVYLGIDPSEAPIPVVPTAHYAMGGIPTDYNGRVRKNEKDEFVVGLYSAGECACVSVHGANRLGCNSLLDTVVFGRRAGKSVCKDLPHLPRGKVPKERIEKVVSFIEWIRNNQGKETVSQIRRDLQSMMMDKCSVFRDEKGLKELIEDLKGIRERFKKIKINDKSLCFNTELLEAIELYHMINLAEAIAVSALQRTESRGAHYRKDYPQRDDANWLKHTFIFKKDGNFVFKYRPVKILKFKPQARVY